MGLILSRFICGVLGNVYPGYMSYKTVKNRDVAEYKRWMKYWIVYAFFTVAEIILDWFAAILPLYYEIKILFVLYLMLPQFMGATTVYDSFLLPLLNEHEEAIDSKIVDARTAAGQTVTNVAEEARRRGSGKWMEAMAAVTDMIKTQKAEVARQPSGLANSQNAADIANEKKAK
mmetsp:Transcript_32945/g.86232  ORF Transcript_32945/g.86232 Transcript_32945/m.86232 type:complete len:174 (-) Transcript_32945:888-1409(-)